MCGELAVPLTSAGEDATAPVSSISLADLPARVKDGSLTVRDVPFELLGPRAHGLHLVSHTDLALAGALLDLVAAKWSERPALDKWAGVAAEFDLLMFKVSVCSLIIFIVLLQCANVLHFNEYSTCISVLFVHLVPSWQPEPFGSGRRPPQRHHCLFALCEERLRCGRLHGHSSRCPTLAESFREAQQVIRTRLILGTLEESVSLPVYIASVL